MIARRATFVLGSYQRYENPHALKPVRGRESPQFKTYFSGVREAVERKMHNKTLVLLILGKQKPRPEVCLLIAWTIILLYRIGEIAVDNSVLQP